MQRSTSFHHTSQPARSPVIRLMEAVRLSLRHAGRALVRRPGLTVIIVATLALGIGANTLLFSVVHGILLKPLPYPNADRLVNLYRIDPELTGDNPTPARCWPSPAPCHC